jgi:hypothetical protein
MLAERLLQPQNDWQRAANATQPPKYFWEPWGHLKMPWLPEGRPGIGEAWYDFLSECPLLTQTDSTLSEDMQRFPATNDDRNLRGTGVRASSVDV